MKAFVLLIWFTGFTHYANQQPYAMVTAHCDRSFDVYAGNHPWVLDANWRWSCTEVPTIDAMEKGAKFTFNPETVIRKP